MDPAAVKGARRCLFAVLWLSSNQAVSQAAEPSGIDTLSIGVPQCAERPWSADAWRDLLRVELAADAIRIGQDSESSAKVTLEPVPCSASAVEALMTFAFGGVTQTRRIVLTDVEPEARPRVLAMATAQLIRRGFAIARLDASQAPLPPIETRAEQNARSNSVAHDLAPTRAPERPLAGLVPFAAGEARAFLPGSSGLFGGRIGATVPLAGWSAIAFDAGALFGGANDQLGTIDGGVGSLGLSLLGVGGTRAISVAVGPRIDLGIGWFRGHPTSSLTTGSNVTSPVALFTLSGSVTFPISGRFAGLLGLDAGTTLFAFSVRADNRDIVTLQGATLSTRVGFAWVPGP